MAGHIEIPNALSRRSQSKGPVAATQRRWHRRLDALDIVCCADNSLYVGWTNDLVTRVQMHNEGRGGRYTANRSPVIYSESYDSSEPAIAREQQLKRWTTKKKQALIAGDLADLKALSKRHKK